MLLSSRASAVPATCSPGKVGAGKARRWRGDAAVGGAVEEGTASNTRGRQGAPPPGSWSQTPGRKEVRSPPSIQIR